MTKTKIDPLTDWKGFYEELKNESARGAVIIASAFLDAQLRNLISKSLIDDKKSVDELLGTEKTHGPLHSFDSRIKAAHCLGLISESMREDLIAIKNIRNPFAHKMHGYSFNEPDIIRLCNSLKSANMITDSIPNFPNSPGNKFLVGVTLLANQLALKTLEVERTHKSVLGDSELGEVIRLENESKVVTQNQA
jgi:DNA-binding MltR family transcriptional regulator